MGEAAVGGEGAVLGVHVAAVHVPVEGREDGVAGGGVIGDLHGVEVVADDLLQLAGVRDAVVFAQLGRFLGGGVAHPAGGAVDGLVGDGLVESFKAVHGTSSLRYNLTFDSSPLIKTCFKLESLPINSPI